MTSWQFRRHGRVREGRLGEVGRAGDRHVVDGGARAEPRAVLLVKVGMKGQAQQPALVVTRIPPPGYAREVGIDLRGDLSDIEEGRGAEGAIAVDQHQPRLIDDELPVDPLAAHGQEDRRGQPGRDRTQLNPDSALGDRKPDRVSERARLGQRRRACRQRGQAETRDDDP
jgi:hypothetical protein